MGSPRPCRPGAGGCGTRSRVPRAQARAVWLFSVPLASALWAAVPAGGCRADQEPAANRRPWRCVRHPSRVVSGAVSGHALTCLRIHPCVHHIHVCLPPVRSRAHVSTIRSSIYDPSSVRPSAYLSTCSLIYHLSLPIHFTCHLFVHRPTISLRICLSSVHLCLHLSIIDRAVH